MPIFNLDEDFKLLKVNDTCAIIADDTLDESQDPYHEDDGNATLNGRLLWHKNLLSLDSSALPAEGYAEEAIISDSEPVSAGPGVQLMHEKLPISQASTKAGRRRSSLYNKFIVNPADPTVRLSLSEEQNEGSSNISLTVPSNDTVKSRRGSSFSKTGEIRDLDDFVPIRCLGEGAYGKVLLVKDSVTSKLYAMKQLKKAEILIAEDSLQTESKKSTVEKRVERTFAERTILSQLEHPNIVKLFYSFHDNHKLYLVLQFIPGGELFYHLKEQGTLDEDTVAFYSAELSCALSFLHSKGIVYRDLKPENCLLDERGHLVLTDFGLSKKSVHEDSANTSEEGENVAHLYSIIGTPEYCAPEILAGEPYSRNCDWYSLGCLVYDMLIGKPPFTGANHKVILGKIRQEKNGARIPSYLSDGFKDYLGALLKKDPSKRWDVDKFWSTDGVKKKKKAGQAKTTSYIGHFIFRKINWPSLMNGDFQKMSVGPILPIITDWELAENFDTEFTERRLDTSIYDNGIKIEKSQRFAQESAFSGSTDYFKGFSYVASRSYMERHF